MRKADINAGRLSFPSKKLAWVAIVCAFLSGTFPHNSSAQAEKQEDPRQAFVRDTESLKKTSYTRRDFREFIVK